jgi:hypothetical protein
MSIDLILKYHSTRSDLSRNQPRSTCHSRSPTPKSVSRAPSPSFIGRYLTSHLFLPTAKETLQPDATKSDSAVAGQTLTGKISEYVSHTQRRSIRHRVDIGRPDRSAASSTRQGPVDQLQSQVKPESSKTLGDKASDAMDTAASAVTPESNKTFGQKFGDTVNPDKYGTTVKSDEHGHAETTGQKP